MGFHDGGAIEVIPDGLKVHFTKLREPERQYVADFAWVQLRRGAVRFCFGQESLDKGETLRTRLEVRYSYERFVDQYWDSSREFHAALARFRVSPDYTERASVHPEQWASLRDHAETANFSYIARSGSEGVIDFHSLPPSGVARLVQGMGPGGLHVDPIVRVQLTTVELVHLLDLCEPLVAGVRERLVLGGDADEAKNDDADGEEQV